MKTLKQMRVGSTAILGEICAEQAFRRRLMEMGLLPGTRIRLTRPSPTSALPGLAEMMTFMPKASPIRATPCPSEP